LADGFIQVPTDSTGKIVDTSELTVSAKTVERQRIVVADPTTAANLATVSAAGALKVDGSGATQPVSIAAHVTADQGTAAAASGSWPVEVTDGTNVLGTATHPVRSDPTGTTTQPVSGTVTANLGTIAGVATAAKQPALGTAGTASSDVITIQGITSMTKLLVTPDSVALPANQSVNNNQVVGTTIDVNSGNKSAGTQRVVLATDQPALTNALKVDGSAVTQPVQSVGNGAVLSNQQAVTATAAALASNACRKALIKALVANSINVYVGPSGITTSTGYELGPGEAVTLDITNTNLVFVIASTTGASVSWIATN
jgi:hypothetical protein